MIPTLIKTVTFTYIIIDIYIIIICINITSKRLFTMTLRRCMACITPSISLKLISITIIIHTDIILFDISIFNFQNFKDIGFLKI